jgi:hypothetical protein
LIRVLASGYWGTGGVTFTVICLLGLPASL